MRLLKLLTLLSLLVTFSFGQTKYWIAREPNSVVTASEAQAVAELADAIDGISSAEADILYTVAGGGALTLGSLIVDNLTFDTNAITSTAGDITITPLASNDIVLDSHFEFDLNLLTALTDANTVIAAYAGKNITIEDVTFDGGVVAGITTLTTTGDVDVGGDFTPATITMAQAASANTYTWLQYNQWTTGADMAAGGTYGAYNKLNIGHTVQNAIAGKSTVRYLTLAADESVNYAAGHEITLELDDVSTHTLTVTDHLSALNLYFDGIGQVEGVGGGAYSKMNLSRALWNSTANFAIETNGYQVETAPNSYLDYGFNVYNDGTMQAGLWIHNNPANGTMVSDIKTSSGAMIFTGDAANGDAVYAEVGGYDATGSIYLSTAAGDLFIQVANAGAATDWERMTSADSD